MDFNLYKNRIEDIQLNNLKDLNNELIFYYDETNNIRKFLVKDNIKLNIPVEDISKNFVLGGVTHYKNENIELNFDILKKNLNVNNNAKEIKLKHITKGTFLESLDSKKLTIFLEWLNSKKLYVHYGSLNLIHWSLCDIVESIIKPQFLEIHQDLKTVLTEIAKVNIERMISYLIKHDYPNIKRGNENLFINDLKTFIRKNKKQFLEKNPKLNIDVLHYLYALLENAERTKLSFIKDEKDGVLIDSFFEFYLRTPRLFKNSVHIFDNEDNIEKKLDYFNLVDETGNECNSIRFEDSERNELIQVSDIITGLIGKAFDYSNNKVIDEIEEDINNLNERQKINLDLLKNILIKSEKENKAFINSIQSVVDWNKITILLF